VRSYSNKQKTLSLQTAIVEAFLKFQAFYKVPGVNNLTDCLYTIEFGDLCNLQH
jgi:hypothetical protein